LEDGGRAVEPLGPCCGLIVEIERERHGVLIPPPAPPHESHAQKTGDGQRAVRSGLDGQVGFGRVEVENRRLAVAAAALAYACSLSPLVSGLVVSPLPASLAMAQ
jgi:hypothetical protein